MKTPDRILFLFFSQWIAFQHLVISKSSFLYESVYGSNKTRLR